MFFFPDKRADEQKCDLELQINYEGLQMGLESRDVHVFT